MPDVWRRDHDWKTLRDTPSVQDAMLAKLAEPGGVGIIWVDAYWEKSNAYRRPFAGIAQRGFAGGVARIARLAQCPIVPFVAVLGAERRSARIEWGAPIDPPELADRAMERRVLDLVIDWLERAVARHPTQYLHPLGRERLWDADNTRWLP
jgi:lauroyl/myristoyl acyltransferase